MRKIVFGSVIIVLGFVGTLDAAEVSFTVREAGRPQPMPARFHLRDEIGKVIKPPALPAWNDHFVSMGLVDVTLSPGNYRVEVERGPEFTSAVLAFQVTDIETNFSLTLKRIADLAEEGWWSGETHVHREPRDAELLLRAEDLHVAQVITWWNRTNPWRTNALPGKLPVQFDSNRFYHHLGGEDERDGGALLFMDLAAPLEITSGTKHYPSSLIFAQKARQQGAKWIDAEKPFWWDFPMWLAHGVVDTVGIAHNHMHRSGVLDSEAWGRERDREQYPGPQGNGRYTQEIYYRVLNGGVRMPPSAGSASGVLPNPVGHNRVYVQVDGEFTYKKWREGLTAGRSFVSNGPLLRCRANAQFPGHVFENKGPLEIRLEGKVDSRDPLAVLELVHNGHIEKIRLPHRFTLHESGWFLVRATADVTNTFRFASTAPWYVEIGGQAMKPRAEAAQFFLDWSRDRLKKLDSVSAVTPLQKEALLQPWRETERFWADKLTNKSPEAR